MNNSLPGNDLDIVKEIINSSIKGTIPVIKESVDSLVNSNGKMLRPSFLIISSRLGTPEPDKIHKLAAAVELLHIASLIHDDIIDDSDKRRGKPAIHRIYGKRNAVLIGDFLFSKSFALLAANTSTGNGAEMARIMGRICEGEINQNISIFTDDFTVRSYTRRIMAKTALMFMLSFHIGAAESGCSVELQSILKRIGYNIGMSFQIIDDILDYTGSETLIGKPSGNDLKAGIYTAPLIFVINKNDSALKTLVRKRPYSRRTILKIINKTIELGGITEAEERAAIYSKRALKEINLLPEGYTKESLKKITMDLLYRDH
ncbi:MAG: polyprenyl synthetase family protein [Spirochaetia bacterium]|nr:polyprenyl synthetase family protein [Spirochaetia bacterium]